LINKTSLSLKGEKKDAIYDSFKKILFTQHNCVCLLQTITLSSSLDICSQSLPLHE